MCFYVIKLDHIIKYPDSNTTGLIDIFILIWSLQISGVIYSIGFNFILLTLVWHLTFVIGHFHLHMYVNPESTELRSFNFQPHEVVSRYPDNRDTQLQFVFCVIPAYMNVSRLKTFFTFNKLIIQAPVKRRNVNCSRHQCSKD